MVWIGPLSPVQASKRQEDTDHLVLPLYTYNDALLRHLAGDSLHYYMNGDDLLARFTLAGHNICVEESCHATLGRHPWQNRGHHASTGLKFVAYYDNHMIYPMEVQFSAGDSDTSISVQSFYSSFRNRNFIYEPEAFDIIQEELVTRLNRLRRFGKLYDIMVNFGFEYLGSNCWDNIYLFDGVPYFVALCRHSATFQFESCGVYAKHFGGGCPTTFRKSIYDTVIGKDKVLWKDLYKEKSFSKYLRFHGSISRNVVTGRLIDIVSSYEVDLKYGRTWYDEKVRDFVKVTADS